LNADPSLVGEVFGHLSRLLATNLNVARVFVPTMSTVTQMVSAGLMVQAGAQSAIEAQ